MFEPELAQAVVEQHFRAPRHKGCCEAATANGATTNPMCGDELSVTLRVSGGVIECARFEGQGCAVSQAGASLVFDALQGRPIEGVKSELTAFLRGMSGGELADCGELAALYVVRDNAARVTCATLAATEVLRLLAESP